MPAEKVAGAERLVGPARRIRAGVGHGTFFNDRAKVREPRRDTPKNIFRWTSFVNDPENELCTAEKTQARSATAIGRFAPRLFSVINQAGECGRAYGAAATIDFTVQKSLSIAPMLMYQHSRSGVCWPGR